MNWTCGGEWPSFPLTSTSIPPVKGIFAASIAHTILSIHRTQVALYIPLYDQRSCWELGPTTAHSPGRYRVPLGFEGTVLASHSDLLDIIRCDTQIGPMDSDADAPTQRACLRLDLKLAEAQ